jgi:hypothetical protein
METRFVAGGGHYLLTLTSFRADRALTCVGSKHFLYDYKVCLGCPRFCNRPYHVQ